MTDDNSVCENEIVIYSTDKDRTDILSRKSLTIVPWDQSKELHISDPNESTAHALRRYCNELKIRDKDIIFNEFDKPVKFTRTTLRESITQMSKRGANLVDFGKLLSVLEPVCQNAIKIEVEKYRHESRKGQDVKQTHQLLSAFHDGEKAYPVKITIHEKEKQQNQFYMVITVGSIDISSKIKEALTNTGAVHNTMNWSLPDGGASFKISIPDFVADFKRDESIIIKNLPDGMPSKEQQDIKQIVREADRKKEIEIKIRLSDKEINQLRAQGFNEKEVEMVLCGIDNISKLSSMKLNRDNTPDENMETILDQYYSAQPETRRAPRRRR